MQFLKFFALLPACAASRIHQRADVMFDSHAVDTNQLSDNRPQPIALKNGIEKPRWSIPEDSLVQYYFTLRENFKNESNYNDPNFFTAGSHPECNFPMGDVDDDGNLHYNLLGSKLPDSCCSDLIKAGPPTSTTDAQGHPATCYIYPFSNWPNQGDDKQMRLYLGCSDGKLIAAENCIPEGTEFYNKSTFVDGTFTYPMDKSVADKAWKNSTAAGCNCFMEDAMNNGPGCYLAASTGLDYQMKFGSNPSDSRGMVFLRVDGKCSA